MDENALYSTIGRLYAELINAGNIVQNQNNVINQLQQKISELEEVRSNVKPAVTLSAVNQVVKEDKENISIYSPIP